MALGWRGAGVVRACSRPGTAPPSSSWELAGLLRQRWGSRARQLPHFPSVLGPGLGPGGEGSVAGSPFPGQGCPGGRPGPCSQSARAQSPAGCPPPAQQRRLMHRTPGRLGRWISRSSPRPRVSRGTCPQPPCHTGLRGTAATWHPPRVLAGPWDESGKLDSQARAASGGGFREKER